MSDTSTDETTPMTEEEQAEAAERDARPDNGSVPETESTDLPLPDYAADALDRVREAAQALTDAEHAHATKGRMVDKGEADRQTNRLQARATHALVELIASGALTPPVATIETFNTFEVVSDDTESAESEETPAAPEAEKSAKTRKA